MGDDGRPAPPDPDAPTRISETGGGSAQTRLATTRRNVPTGDLPRAWADFELLRELGRGGMGVVYEARQIGLGRTVAVKIMLAADHELRRRFEREGRALALVDSPHVVRVFHAGALGDELYFAMEFVRGQDLAQRLKGGWRPTHAEALALVRQAAIGLAAAAKHGLIHRDIKPGNMMLADDGTLKLMDFGLVRIADDAQPLTTSGLVMGTVHYFSPEQGMGQKCDHRSDLYSLGVVFFELLTGRRPFSGDSAAALIYQHIHAEPPMPRLLDPSITLGFQRVVLRCLSKRPDQRYQDARELILDLDRLSGERDPTREPSRERRVLGFSAIVSAAVLAVALIAAALWRMHASPRGEVVVDPAIARHIDAPRDASTPAHDATAPAHDATAPAHDATAPEATKPPIDPSLPARDPVTPAHENLVPDTPPSPDVVVPPKAPTAAEPIVAIANDPPAVPTDDTPKHAPQTPDPSEPAARSPTPDAPAPALAVTGPKPAPPALALPQAPPGFGAVVGDDHAPYADLAIGAVNARFRWCKPGEFTMGSAAVKDAMPHRVRLTKGFWLAETETTQALWRAVGADDPSKDRGDGLPVDDCSRDDCERFLAKLRARVPGLKARLPTEAEWEYACRAGGDLAGDAQMPGQYDGQSAPRAPGGFAANAWGLRDMIGNVAEWVADDYAKYRTGDATDPRVSGGKSGVARGGYWEDAPAACRPASRDELYLGGYRARFAGMRIAIDAP